MIVADRGKHCEKSAAVYELNEKMCPNKRRLVLFARKRREGWAAWGTKLRANRFHEDLKEGEKWLRVALHDLQFLLPHTIMVKYGELRRGGVDEKVGLRKANYDVKTGSTGSATTTLHLKLFQLLKQKSPGWYYRSNSSILIYHWLDTTGARSEKLYILGPKRLRGRKFVEEVV